ncbi:hypothetical protein PVK64_17675 [Aliivibrio sp. S4TY2]|uniref:hypothetical protein n=1 Tax=unclassified Aliivibrio TaxID=2645654 RepID=UPI002379357B|nr:MULTISPECIES: hypothetical protein [unclassified Aliivibrio]MDD9157995.1 hypothetical protein [Aliivibrio sp. S4TY2]MDD9161962.1 hypothetical protein [Aliivibrio sp. S4TY1]MDD9165992.1 hypothetical protein [Aliivibrio sp. S4MY2]MDD9170042.1 hypothetical protein [Aliivibrio sp. S4MY4]MDD9187093.1 hypothetical protein [Aliivibrio sp. S4MY3]
MGFVVAVICGLLFVPMYQSKMTKGQLGVGKTFWFFGVFMISLLIFLSKAYVEYQGAVDSGKYLGAVKTVFIFIGFYCFFVFLGIWRSAKELRLRKKITMRCFSIFVLGITFLSLFFSLAYSFIIIFTIYLTFKFRKSNGTRNCT